MELLCLNIDYYTYGMHGIGNMKISPDRLTMRVSLKKSANSMYAAGIVLLARVAALKEH